MGVYQNEVFNVSTNARWDPASYTWSYNPYKWPYKWVTAVITLVIGLYIGVISSNPIYIRWWPILYYQGSTLKL